MNICRTLKLVSPTSQPTCTLCISIQLGCHIQDIQDFFTSLASFYFFYFSQ